MTDEVPTRCVCPHAGQCELLGWQGKPRAMSAVRHAQCQDPAYFAVFHAERERYAQQVRSDRIHAVRRADGSPSARRDPMNRVTTNPGPGTILARNVAPWVKRFCRATGSCTCRKLQAEMDDRGPDWCEQNIEDIVERLAENARSLGCWIPFPATLARWAVTGAIREARESAKIVPAAAVAVVVLSHNYGRFLNQ